MDVQAVNCSGRERTRGQRLNSSKYTLLLSVNSGSLGASTMRKEETDDDDDLSSGSLLHCTHLFRNSNSKVRNNKRQDKRDGCAIFGK